jgi:peptide/nickel transport system substrate-binding protein
MGPAFEDVDRVDAIDDTRLRVRLRQPSQFLIEALDAPIQNAGENGAGTGPFVPGASSAGSELRANADYYLGRPSIDRITLTAYPSTRAAWADLLRGNIDMLYEVTADGLDSLQGSNNVSVFSFVRHYQYAITFGANAPALEPADVRRELNAAIDRDAIVRMALGGHGIPSTGPTPSQQWALDATAPKFGFDRSLAKNLASRHLKFTCLVPADSVYERIALAVKQQLAAASVDMRVEEATQEQILEATRSNKFEAVLVDPISGPNMFRVYRQFYSKVAFTPKPRSSLVIDRALDRIRHAASEDEYRAGVTAFQQAVVDDPPALFLAWGERARAVSRRFVVPAQQDSRDVLATLRLWRPATVPQVASRN